MILETLDDWKSHSSCSIRPRDNSCNDSFKLLVITLSNSVTFRFWPFPILTLSNSDTFQFWHFPILTLSYSDTFQFWHFPILKKNAFRHFPILTLSSLSRLVVNPSSIFILSDWPSISTFLKSWESADQRIIRCSITLIKIFWGSKIAKLLVRCFK